ncbi:MAG: class I SAM-dependent methyltransferase [Pseudonocardia sp.]
MTTVDPAPNPHATAAEVAAARHDAKLANVLYHDWEAGSYDEKWSISYDERCISYAAGRFRAVAGTAGWPYGRALELGCGTGFFLLNLMQAGVARRGSVTDLSPGMVAAALRNARGLGLDVDGRVADAERIPYPDATFDLVVGHAVLHHIPDVERALQEVLRVLRPGGRFVFAGEPTRVGDAYARRLGTLTWKAVTTLTRVPALRGWRRPQAELDESSRAAALEALVDQHVFDPDELEATARRAGAAGVRVVTEELTAAMFGWPVRTVEAAVPPGRLVMGWAMFAYRGWQRLSWLDGHLARVVPRGWFYNALVTGTRP